MKGATNMKNVIELNLPKYVVKSSITDQFLAKNLDNKKFEWVKLTPKDSNYQTSFTEKEIKQMESKLASYTKKPLAVTSDFKGIIQ